MTLTVENLTFERNDQPLLKQIGFHLHPGELLQIQGPNGSGKSTLLRILAGIIEPQEGAVLWQCHSIFYDRADYHQTLQYIGHQHGVKPYLTVHENLQLNGALMARKIPSQHITAALQKVGLASLEETPALSLSAGQTRRVALARLFIQPSQIWILDEPTTALDSHSQHCLMELLSEHLAKKGMAIVATHHSLSLSQEIKTLTLGEQ
jgi:heme exporter protein A